MINQRFHQEKRNQIDKTRNDRGKITDTTDIQKLQENNANSYMPTN